MYLPDFSVFTWIERVLEVLIFYLILANLHGFDLPTSFTRLVRNPQRSFLITNVLLLIAYPVAATFLVGAIGQSAYNIDHFIRTIGSFYLLRRALDLKKMLFAFIAQMMIMLLISLLVLVFTIHGPPVFLWSLTIVAFMVHQNHFEDAYVRLQTKKWALNVILFLSSILYTVPAFLQETTLTIFFAFISLILCALLTYFLGVRFAKEDKALMQRIKNVSLDEFFPLLSELSERPASEGLLTQYIIKSHNVVELATPIGKKLELQKLRGNIQDYECVLSKREIKINVMFKEVTSV